MLNKHDILNGGIVHELTNDIADILTTHHKLPELWNNLTPIQRNEWICWIATAQKVETRKERLQRLVSDLSQGKKKPCCWPGCPHRNPNSRKWFRKY
jgi:uncharacterized protein YdeI (YjbR/CyaY-like superfamily)